MAAALLQKTGSTNGSESTQQTKSTLSYGLQRTQHIKTFTANTDVCIDKLREWCKKGVNVSLLDLWKAYLQVRINESL